MRSGPKPANWSTMPVLLHPGEAAPEFELTDPQGRVVRLSDYRGKPIVLAFLRGFL